MRTATPTDSTNQRHERFIVPLGLPQINRVKQPLFPALLQSRIAGV